MATVILRTSNEMIEPLQNWSKILNNGSGKQALVLMQHQIFDGSKI